LEKCGKLWEGGGFLSLCSNPWKIQSNREEGGWICQKRRVEGRWRAG